MTARKYVVTGHRFIIADGESGYKEYHTGAQVELDLPDSSHADHTSRGLLTEVTSKKEAAAVQAELSTPVVVGEDGPEVKVPEQSTGDNKK